MRKRLFAALLAALMLFSCATAEEDLIIEEVLLDETGVEVPAGPSAGLPADGSVGVSSAEEMTAVSAGGASSPAESAAAEVFTPSFGSPYPTDPGAGDYWSLPMDITDEEAVWKMLMAPMTVVRIGGGNQEKKQTYLYREPDENSQKIGVVTRDSQGVRVIEQLDSGWSLIECYSSSFHDTKVKAWNLLVQGYIKSEYLVKMDPNPAMGIVVDKLTQRLYIFQDGHLLTTLLCSTGLVQHNGTKWQPYNETRSGEFFLMSKVGTLKSDRLLCDMAIRFNSGDMVHEVPHVVQADGKTKNYGSTEPKLGTKCSHGCIRVQRYKTPEGINMAWLWSQLKSGSRVKFVIWEDWQGRRIPPVDPNTVLYYNPDGGDYYHRAETCYMAKKRTFQPFLYSQLEEGEFAKLKFCPYCAPAMRAADIEAVNSRYAPGGDHDENMTMLRQDYFDYLRQ